MMQPLMPKATAVWLVENTSLTFDQIGEFCGLHPLEVQAIADGEVAVQMIGIDPVANGQLALDDIERAQNDPAARLHLLQTAHPEAIVKHKGPRYTPIAKRQDKPDAIAWLVKSHPELSDGQISKLVGTTKPTIQAVRERSHWNNTNIKPRHPVALGLCTLEELEVAVNRANRGKRTATGEPVTVTVEAPTYENEDTAAP
ncbi:MAG TPA: cell cycle transcriptional regulator TrcR [Stellaceae bacterium]|nr:cell cycle transcriptional regulator TrcR [Stellaceae bacterium]